MPEGCLFLEHQHVDPTLYIGGAGYIHIVTSITLPPRFEGGSVDKIVFSRLAALGDIRL